MAYYLSKANRAIVEMLIDKLQTKDNDWSLATNKPDKIESAIRSAYSHRNLREEYGWIKDKWIIKVRQGEIKFELRQLHMEEIIQEMQADIIEDPTEFFDVINILVLQKKNKVNFVKCILTADEFENLRQWGMNNNYNISYEAEILHVERIELKT